ncbi:MAG: hypothetical protein JXA21_28765 [Anaerolineae bacterium]|nr:hypothetical protein [Anaerolineae bacterium]
MTQNEIEAWLHSGINAAKAGQRAVARQWLARVVHTDAHNIQAWLWLGAVVETPKERKVCLEKVLSVDPNNVAAHKGLSEVQLELADQLLQEAIVAARGGDHDHARQLLTQAVDYDEENVQAWLWLSRVAETPEDQQVCLENVLALDPDQSEAQEKLAMLQQAHAAAEANLWDTPEEIAPEERASFTAASAILGADYIEKHTSLFPEPEAVKSESPSQSLWAKYEDDLLCPYCAAHTSMDDRRCSTCGNSLWMGMRRNVEPSTGFWILLASSLFMTVLAFCSPLITLFLASVRVGAQFEELVLMYTGISLAETVAPVAPEVEAAALAVLPRITFFITCLPLLAFLLISVALAFRWPPIYYLLLIFSGLNVFWSALQLLGGILHSMLSTIFTGIDIVTSIGMFVAMVQCEDDFKTDRRRILLQVDKDIKNGVDYLFRGQTYAKNQMWALAAIHLRRAAAMLIYQADVQVALALACIHIREYKLAEIALQEAQRINPHEKQIAEVLALLHDRRTK